MDTPDLDTLQSSYKQAVDTWIAVIREEESLASTDHSMISLEHWYQAGFRRQDAGKAALEARQAYEDELRKVFYGI